MLAEKFSLEKNVELLWALNKIEIFAKTLS
jgi:hypothetical protein